MKKILISNGRIIDPANAVDAYENLYIADGQIIARRKNSLADFNPDIVIDASKYVVAPGFIDLDATVINSFHDQSLCQNELSAAIGSGITSLCIPPQASNDLLQNALNIEWLIKTCGNFSKINIFPIGALTRDLAGLQLNELAMLRDAGCIAVSNDNFGIANTEIKRRCYEYAATLNMPVFIYPVDPWLKKEGVIHEGEVSTRLGLKGISTMAESLALSQEIILIENIGIKAHFCRLSCAESVSILAACKDQLFSADVAAHQLLLTEIDASDFNSIYHVYPPLRSEQDRYGLEMGLRDNIISALCSHHQPVSKMAKYAPFPETKPGMSTLETLLPQTLRIAKQIDAPLVKALSWITSNPAKILGIEGGSLSEASKADVCIFDPEVNWTLSSEHIKSWGRNNPFLNWDFTGQVQYTLIGGEIVYQAP